MAYCVYKAVSHEKIRNELPCNIQVKLCKPSTYLGMEIIHL
jgi:hypothetical protein